MMSLHTSCSDIPLNADPSGRFVPWIIALMVYLATISLMVAFIVSALVHRWDTGFSQRLSIEIPASNIFNPQGDSEGAKIREQIIQALLKTPGIGSVRTLPRDEMVSTLKPWLGEGTDVSQLPLPTLLEVEISNRAHLNDRLLTQSLKSLLPGIIIEDHQGWQHGFLDLAYSAQVIGLLIVSMIILAAISTIAFTSQTSLIIHRSVIEILYLVGATDTYIARQFQNHALRVGIKGGTVGFCLSLGTFILLKFFARHLDTTLFEEVISTSMLWGIAILVPFFVTLFMMISARVAVKIALKYVV